MYDEGLRGLPLIQPPHAPASDVHAHHLYPIRLLPDARVNRDQFIKAMADHGVNCSVHFIPLHLHSYWRAKLCVSENMFPEAQRAYEALVTLPLFNSMTDEMHAYVVGAIREILS